MFALIISIIAIALVVALAGATLYYGGDAFTRGSARSTAAALVNQGQQISGAWTLYKANNGGAIPAGDSSAQLTALVSGQFLSAVPTSPVGGTWTVASTTDTGRTVSTLSLTAPASLTAETCTAVSALPGSGGVFKCATDAGKQTFSYAL